MRFGSSADNMVIELRDTSECLVCNMDKDDETLATYGPQENFTLHVIDTQPSAMMQDLEDVTKVEKYEISEDDYNKREGTFRKFKEEMMKKDPKFMEKNASKIPADF